MIYFEETTDFHIDGPSAVTLGKFDGVHRGHQKLLRRVCGRSETDGLRSVVFALNPRKEDLILTPQEQKNVLEDMGFDALVRSPFVSEISGMSPDRFIREVLIKQLGAVYVAVGTDFRFGYQRAGDAAYLAEQLPRFGVEADIIRKETFRGREISSTYIREAIAQGDMPLVSELMGRDFPIHGVVVHGKHLGTKMGMPTANLLPPEGKTLPPDGVYFSRVTVNGQQYNGLTDIGCRPTVNGAFRSVETYIYGLEADLYDHYLQVELLAYHRPDVKFSSIDGLREQLYKDVLAGKAYFNIHG